MTPPRGSGEARQALLDAALHLFRAKGYTAATVDDLCREAGVTKGAFFHHFQNKEALGVAAVEHWDAVTSCLFAKADYQHLPDPLDRVLAYLELRKTLARGTAAEYSCVAGTTVQEVHASHPTIREAGLATILGGAAHVERHLDEALTAHPVPGVTAHELALQVQAVIQGGIVLAKAHDDPQPLRDSIDHLMHYLRLLFGRD